MTVKLNSYLHFVDNTKEAMDFYKSIFGGEIYSDTFAMLDSPENPVAEEDKNKIMHAYLKGDNGIELMASDAMQGMTLDKGSQMSLTLNGDDEVTLRGYWDKLAAEGTVTVPLDKSPWGDIFGMVTDKFGVNWMVDIGPTQQ